MLTPRQKTEYKKNNSAEKRNFTITRTVTSGSPISEPLFRNIKNKVLGKNYDLSLVIIGDKLSKKINKKYKNREKSASVLGFPISKTEGEIFINLAKAKRQSEALKLKTKNFATYLFIHAVLHLKGFSHSSKMESEEKKILRRFGVKLEY